MNTNQKDSNSQILGNNFKVLFYLKKRAFLQIKIFLKKNKNTDGFILKSLMALMKKKYILIELEKIIL
jgi:hypothetical protein